LLLLLLLELLLFLPLEPFFLFLLLEGHLLLVLALGSKSAQNITHATLSH
jgi:hypothetical protein